MIDASSYPLAITDSQTVSPRSLRSPAATRCLSLPPAAEGATINSHDSGRGGSRSGGSSGAVTPLALPSSAAPPGMMISGAFSYEEETEEEEDVDEREEEEEEEEAESEEDDNNNDNDTGNRNRNHNHNHGGTGLSLPGVVAHTGRLQPHDPASSAGDDGGRAESAPASSRFGAFSPSSLGGGGRGAGGGVSRVGVGGARGGGRGGHQRASREEEVSQRTRRTS